MKPFEPSLNKKNEIWSFDIKVSLAYCIGTAAILKSANAVFY